MAPYEISVDVSTGQMNRPAKPLLRLELGLSVLVQQSNAKTALLNSVFGLRQRVSVHKISRGISMTLIENEDQTGFDYIMLLDVVGLRSPQNPRPIG